MRRGIYIKRTNRQRQAQFTSGKEVFLNDVKCVQCKLVFPDYMGCCPKCGSEERVGLDEVNPYTRMPMSSFLKACGHVFWLVGVMAFLIIVWQTDNVEKETALMFFFGGIFILVSGVIMSAAYFALSELIRRVLRIQRRLHAFHETYRSSQIRQQYGRPRNLMYKRRMRM